MALTASHDLYAVNLDSGGTAGDILVDQISDFNVDTAIEEIVQGGAGSVYNQFAAVIKQSPKMAFTTSKIAAVLAKIGLSGLKIETTGTPTGPGLQAFFEKRKDGGTHETGSNHLKMTISKGLLVPMQLSASNESSTLSLEAHAIYDSTNDPIAIANNQALVGSPTVDEQFVAGPVKINGITLSGVEDISISFGLKVEAPFTDGEVWPTFISIVEIQPEITIKVVNALALDIFGLLGAKQGATASKIYLRKLDIGGSRVADATAQHISFTINSGRISVGESGGSLREQVVSEIKITPTYDGTNDPIVISTATAIT